MNNRALLITLGTLTLVLSVTLGILLMIKLQSPPTDSPTAPTTQTPESTATTNLALDYKLTGSGTEQVLEMWLRSLTPTQSISGLAIKTSMTPSADGSIRALVGRPELSDQFTSSQWTTPFAEVLSNPDGTITMNLSAIIMSIQPYMLTDQPVLLASIPLLVTGSPTITAVIDPEVTEFYDQEANRVDINTAGQSIIVITE